MFTTKLVVLIGFVVLVGFGPADFKGDEKPKGGTLGNRKFLC